MDIGWLDVCLRVADVTSSAAFYQRLGFRLVDGRDSDGWAVMVNGEARLGLYSSDHVSRGFSLNFRGGNIAQIVERLQAAGLEFQAATTAGDGSGSAELLDPDGNLLFFDTAPAEVKPV